MQGADKRQSDWGKGESMKGRGLGLVGLQRKLKSGLDTRRVQQHMQGKWQLCRVEVEWKNCVHKGVAVQPGARQQCRLKILQSGI